MGLISLRALSKMIQRQRHYEVCLEWLLCFKHILYCLDFLICESALIITCTLRKPLLFFLNATLTFEHQMVELCTQLFELGLSEHKQRETEVNSFVSAQTKAVKDCQQKVSQILAEFEQQHKEVSCEIHCCVLKRPVSSKLVQIAQ